MNNFFGTDRPYHVALMKAISEGIIKDEHATTISTMLYFRDSATGRCNPSVRKIAEIKSRSESTIKRHIKTLKNAGFIKYIKGGIIDKKHETNRYVFTIKVDDTHLVDVFTGEAYDYEAEPEEHEAIEITPAILKQVDEPVVVDIIDKAIELFNDGKYTAAVITLRDKRDFNNKRAEIEADFDRFTTALHRLYHGHSKTEMCEKLDRCNLATYKYKFDDYPD